MKDVKCEVMMGVSISNLKTNKKGIFNKPIMKRSFFTLLRSQGWRLVMGYNVDSSFLDIMMVSNLNFR